MTGRVAGASEPSAAAVSAAAAVGGDAILRPLVVSSLLAAAWAGLALRSPTTTFHLAPLVVAAAPSITARMRHAVPLGPEGAMRVIAAGLVVATATALLLATFHALSGPAVWGGSGAMETAAAVALGGVWGWRVATRRRAGVLAVLG